MSKQRTRLIEVARGIVAHSRRGTLVRRMRFGKSLGRSLAVLPREHPHTLSARRLNQIASSMDCCNAYLEIGLCSGETFEDVSVPVRVGVDPSILFRLDQLPPGVRVHEVESDRFFAQLVNTARFDLIFLDGLHEWEQTYRDFLSALRHLSDVGVVVIDDVVPDCIASSCPDQKEALATRRALGDYSGAWHGDVYKVVPIIRRLHPDLYVRIVGNHARDENPQAVIWFERGSPPSVTENVNWLEVRRIAEMTTYDRYLSDVVPLLEVPKEMEDLTLQLAAEGRPPYSISSY